MSSTLKRLQSHSAQVACHAIACKQHVLCCVQRRIEAGAAIPLRRQRIYYEGTELAGHLTIMDLVLPKMSHEDRSRGAALPRLGNLDVLTEPPLSTVWVSADMEGAWACLDPSLRLCGLSIWGHELSFYVPVWRCC